MCGLWFLTAPEESSTPLHTISYKGPIAKFLSPEQKQELTELVGIKEGETLFFICDAKNVVNRLAGEIRTLQVDCEDPAYPSRISSSHLRT